MHWRRLFLCKWIVSQQMDTVQGIYWRQCLALVPSLTPDTDTIFKVHFHYKYVIQKEPFDIVITEIRHPHPLQGQPSIIEIHIWRQVRLVQKRSFSRRADVSPCCRHLDVVWLEININEHTFLTAQMHLHVVFNFWLAQVIGLFSIKKSSFVLSAGTCFEQEY